MAKRTTCKFDLLFRAVAFAWVVCVASNSVPVFASNSQIRQDLVFCPLRKQLVKRNVPAPIVPRVSLADVCAAERDKSNFLKRLVFKVRSKLLIIDQDDADALFFDYNANGDQAFTGTFPTPGRSRSNEISLAKIQLGANGGRVDPVVENTQLLSPAYLSRPPTSAAEPDLPESEFVDLENIPHAVRPRAPPVSL